MYSMNYGKALRPIHNHIIFQFIDPIIGRFFGGTTDAGLFLTASQEGSATEPRWGKVYALGHECSDELSGAYKQEQIEVLIEPLMWTQGFHFNEEKYWRTDESKILAWRYVNEK